MSESGGSAERKAADLAAAGDAAARAWALGAAGERRVAEALKNLPEGWVALHDRLLYPGVTDSNIDHIVVGPGGIFMIDAKNRGGDISVYRNFLYQHTVRPDGQKQSVNLQSEVAKAGWIVNEMARRLTVPVLPVLALAGRRSHQFASPQFVQGVSVVSVERLVEWLTVQAPRMSSAHHGAWVRQVMTEFPSTTTDPLLLQAIGADLVRRAPTRAPTQTPTPIRTSSSPRTTRPRQSTTRTPPRTPTRTPRNGSKNRRRSTALGFVGLGLMAIVLLGGGRLPSYLGEKISGLVTGAVLRGSAAPTASQAPGCSGLRVDDLEGLAAARPTTLGGANCEWTAPSVDTSGTAARAVVVTFAGGLLGATPDLAEARLAGTPRVRQGVGINGVSTMITIAAGQSVPLDSGSHVMRVDARVTVDHQRLGLSDDRGLSLAYALLARVDDGLRLPATPSPR